MDGGGEHRVEAARGTVGDRLRAAREAEGLTLDEVAARTRIPMRHLAMIEDGRYAGLPAATYSAGFVKAYARLLGLDGRALSDEFRQAIGSAVVRPSRPEPYEPADPRRTPPLALALVALLVAVVAGLGFLYWRGSSDQANEIAARGVPREVAGPVAAAPTAAPAAIAAASAPQPAGGPVIIGATQEVWIKVAGGGRTLFMGTLKPGDRIQVPSNVDDPVLTTGRPGVTTISVGETPIPPVGEADRAVHDVSLKPEALLARLATPAPAIQPPADASTPVDGASGPA